MRALFAFARELVRVTWPIAALGIFALLFAPARASEQHTASEWDSAPVRCDQPSDLVALGAHSLPNAVQTAYAADGN
jgi:hypothetical protein